MDEQTRLSPAPAPASRLTRRGLLRLGLFAAALAPVAAACGGSSPAQAPAAPAAPAAPSPAPAAPAAPAAASPAAAPAAPAAASPAAAAASPAAAAAAPAASPAAGARPAPAPPTFNKVQVNGKVTIVQSRDFHPDHNTLIETKIKEFADKQGYPLDHSYIEAYAGAGNVVTKLTAAVQAGDAPDMIIHTLRPAELKFLDIIEDTDTLTNAIVKDYGKLLPTFEKRTKLDGKYWAVPHFSRAGGFWVRENALKDAGVDWRKEFTDWDHVRDAVLKASKPEKESWGWGMTVNRSGDGETLVRTMVMMWGGQLTDETGQIVVLNKDPYRQYAIAGMEWLKDIYTNSKYQPMLPPGVNAWTDPSNNEAYLAGKIFYTSNAGTLYAKAIVDNNPVYQDTYLTPSPKGMGAGGRSLDGAGDAMSFFLMKGAKNRPAAEQFIQYLMTPDIQRQMFKISTGYVYPAYEWGWDEPQLTQVAEAARVTPAWKAIATNPQGYTAGEWPGPPTPWTASLENSNFWTDMFGEVLGGKAVPDALKSAHDRAVRVFKEFGAKGE